MHREEKNDACIIGFNGSPHKDGCTFTALSEGAAQLKKRGIDSEIFWIGNKPIRGCIDASPAGEKDAVSSMMTA